MEQQEKIPRGQRLKSVEKINDNRAESNLPNDGISVSEYVGAPQNGKVAEKLVLFSTEMGDRTFRR